MLPSKFLVLFHPVGTAIVWELLTFSLWRLLPSSRPDLRATMSLLCFSLPCRSRRFLREAINAKAWPGSLLAKRLPATTLVPGIQELLARFRFPNHCVKRGKLIAIVTGVLCVQAFHSSHPDERCPEFLSRVLISPSRDLHIPPLCYFVTLHLPKYIGGK